MRQKLNRVFSRLPLSFLRGRVADAGDVIGSSRTYSVKTALLNAINAINPEIGHLRVRDSVKTNYVSNGSLAEGAAHRFPRGLGGKRARIPPSSLNRCSVDSFSLAVQSTSTLREENGATTSRLQFAMKQLDCRKANLDAAYSRFADPGIARGITQFDRYGILVQAGATIRPKPISHHNPTACICPRTSLGKF